MKKSLIVANWKCNPTTLKKAKTLLNSVEKGIKNIKNAEVVICPPFVYLGASAFAKGYGGLAFGSQDVFCENSGAYTGQVSPLMLKNMGIKYVIVGHSERRKHCRETNEMIFKKIKAALTHGLKPILCIDKITQLPAGVDKEVIIAYEPLFAIGTGKPCSLKRAKKMRLAIERSVGGKNPILYGGSVNARNAKDYVCRAGFQGILVGRASLNPKEFIDIVKNICYC